MKVLFIVRVGILIGLLLCFIAAFIRYLIQN